MPVAKVESSVFVKTKHQAEVERDYDDLMDGLIRRGIAVFSSSLKTTLVDDVDESEEAVFDLLGSQAKTLQRPL